MPLAPRQRSSAESGRGSNNSAAGQAAKRKRTREANGTTNNKSVGVSQRMADYPGLDWATVENDVVHVTDIAGKVTQSQMGAGGYYTMNCAIPMSYIHEAIEAALASQQGMLYIRFYTVPIELFLEARNGEHTTT